MGAIRLGAVSYLNTKPLVEGLDRRTDLFSIRYDVPAVCASLLHESRIDLGLIPAIEYLRGGYRIVPGVAIGSDGPVASVAVYSRVEMREVKTLALDPSSRTSVALTRVLCARQWRIAPRLIAGTPDLDLALNDADAALIIGDPALTIDAAARGLKKVDLGSEWQALTGLPFVYAMWCGRDGACRAAHVEALNAARDEGVAAIDRLAREASCGDIARERQAQRYLSDNLKYGLGPRELEGLQTFHRLAVEDGLGVSSQALRFFTG